ncbi:uncharacterized protein LOC130778729 [Actinidia eriantha]|uniref:uncharacterized protein LOC130778729 n=1 Tax=Actinidia eriantha TaxID=165200 RepID=UPI00258FA04F|nr:uncharacterized protein LOC130778729 [Actinidia eriantha]
MCFISQQQHSINNIRLQTDAEYELHSSFPRTQSRTPVLLKPLADPAAAASGEEVTKDKFHWRRRKEGIAALVDDAEVVWEQRLSDVEAESGGVEHPVAAVSVPSWGCPVSDREWLHKGHHTDSWFFIWCYSLCGDRFWSLYGRGFNSYQNVGRRLPTERDCISPRAAVTQILWRPQGLLVDQFIVALFTSSFIRGYLAPRPATVFRNRFCVDGGLTLFMPPTSAAHTETCDCSLFLLCKFMFALFPASLLGLPGTGISPDCNPKNRASPGELFQLGIRASGGSYS